MNLSELKAPFPPGDIEFRAGATNKEKTKALAWAYITSRAVMDRLDNVVGPEGWQDEFRPGPDGGIVCGLSIRVGDEWVTKWDGAENTNYEPVKGGLSDSFKRAAVKWGVGRYLYDLPAVFVNIKQRGKNITIDENEARAKVLKLPRPQQHPPPAPKQNGNIPNTRTPEQLQQWLTARTAEYGNVMNGSASDPASAAQVGLIASKLEECFAGDSEADKKRRNVIKYLFEKDSTKQLTKAQARAVLDWILAGKDKDTGDYILSPDAIQEAREVERELSLDAGQQEMFTGTPTGYPVEGAAA